MLRFSGFEEEVPLFYCYFEFLCRQTEENVHEYYLDVSL